MQCCDNATQGHRMIQAFKFRRRWGGVSRYVTIAAISRAEALELHRHAKISFIERRIDQNVARALNKPKSPAAAAVVGESKCTTDAQHPTPVAAPDVAGDGFPQPQLKRARADEPHASEVRS